MSWRFYDITTPQGQITFPSVTSVIGFYNPDKIWLERAEKAIETGKVVHSILDRLSKGGSLKSDEWESLPEEVRQSVRAYIRWQRESHYKPLYGEIVVYSLKYEYATTIDTVGFFGRKGAIGDWKTGTIFKPESVEMQVVAGKRAYLEMYPHRKLDIMFWLELNKKTGYFTDHRIQNEREDELFAKFLGMKKQAIPNSMNTNIKEVSMTLTNSQNNKVTKYQQKNLEVQAQRAMAIESFKIFYPKATHDAIMKAAIYCASYKLDPGRDVFLIPFKDEWVVVWGIKATRKVAQRSGFYSYVDDSPRVMTEEEQMKIFGRIKEPIRAICKLRDERGNEASGYGYWPEGQNPQGTDKGNSPENMAFIRAERNAIEKLKSGAIPQGVEVMDESFIKGDDTDFQEVPFEIEASNGASNGKIPVSENNATAPSPAPISKPSNGLPKPDYGVCPIHNVPWQSGNNKWGSYLYHPQSDAPKGYCKKKNVDKVNLETGEVKDGKEDLKQLYIKDKGTLFTYCLDKFKLQPSQVIKDLGLSSDMDIVDLQDSWATIAELHLR
uniref:Putative DNA recombination protein n=1 Tax=viral metagenome TaxID=1070528 RepID=A0A6M3J3U1_9ZZZZ